jgi:hypothetical protein
MPPPTEQPMGIWIGEVSGNFVPTAGSSAWNATLQRPGAQIETLITRTYATPENIRKPLIDIYQLGRGAENK